MQNVFSSQDMNYRPLKIREVRMDVLVSVQPESIKVRQMTNLNGIFNVMGDGVNLSIT